MTVRSMPSLMLPNQEGEELRAEPGWGPSLSCQGHHSEDGVSDLENSTACPQALELHPVVGLGNGFSVSLPRVLTQGTASVLLLRAQHLTCFTLLFPSSTLSPTALPTIPQLLSPQILKPESSIHAGSNFSKLSLICLCHILPS